MPFWEEIKNIDKILFVLIHNDADQKLMDGIMLFIRNAVTWIPLYLFLLVYSFKKMQTKAWLFIAGSIVVFAITDSLSASVLKPLFARPRPCYDAEIHSYIRNVIDCGGLYSFPSSHASNHFGLAAFWFFSIQRVSGKKWKWLWAWATVIGYAQIYVGKHFPLDIVGGAILGIIVGALIAQLFSYFWEHTPQSRSLTPAA
ncbi:MAG: phosphatase PAP2 family protein [Chitinophagaceae bacterium]